VPSPLEEMLGIIVSKARDIKNPVEAAFFLWLNIAYLQPFEDGNKRTSRLSANIPLLMYNCAPLRFLDVTDEDYSRARIGMYERLDTSVPTDLFAWTYRQSIEKYAVLIQAAGLPDLFRAVHRNAISELVSRVVPKAIRSGRRSPSSISRSMRRAAHRNSERRHCPPRRAQLRSLPVDAQGAHALDRGRLAANRITWRAATPIARANRVGPLLTCCWFPASPSPDPCASAARDPAYAHPQRHVQAQPDAGAALS
jgi:hypothetical protein